MGLDAQGGTNENTEAEPRHARTTTVDLPRFNDTERAQRIGEQLRKRDLIHFGTPEVCSCCCIKCIILTAEPGVVDYYNLLHLLQIFFLLLLPVVLCSLHTCFVSFVDYAPCILPVR